MDFPGKQKTYTKNQSSAYEISSLTRIGCTMYRIELSQRSFQTRSQQQRRRLSSLACSVFKGKSSSTEQPRAVSRLPLDSRTLGRRHRLFIRRSEPVRASRAALSISAADSLSLCYWLVLLFRLRLRDVLRFAGFNFRRLQHQSEGGKRVCAVRLIKKCEWSHCCCSSRYEGISPPCLTF